jgi:hypothetical protein
VEVDLQWMEMWKETYNEWKYGSGFTTDECGRVFYNRWKYGAVDDLHVPNVFEGGVHVGPRPPYRAGPFLAGGRWKVPCPIPAGSPRCRQRGRRSARRACERFTKKGGAEMEAEVYRMRGGGGGGGGGGGREGGLSILY